MFSLLRFLLGYRFFAALWVLGGVVAAQAQSNYEPYYFGRFAGNYPGSDDGAGSAARFHDPEGVTMDSAGNVYVADYGNSTIRKITPVGVVTTFAGLAGKTGSIEGPGGAARFNHPTGVAVDSSGNVYVADYFNHTVRKINSAGVVSTLAGLAGVYGGADGTGSAARFYGPSGVAVDMAGNIYVAEYFDHTIRKVTPAGVVTTVAGLAGSAGSADGTGSAARFAFPNSVAVESQGNVYVADTKNHTIRKITPAGIVTTLAGLANNPGSNDGTGSAARFFQPFGVAADSGGNVSVADSSNHTIRKITPAGVVTTVAGLAGNYGSDDGTGSAARFSYPGAVVVDNAANVYVGDADNNTIRKITPARVVTTLAGLPGGHGSDEGTGSAARFGYPTSAAVDSASNVYVADTDNNTIRRITSAGVVTTLAGLANSIGSNDGTGSAARFQRPQGVAVDANGNVYVADTFNFTIRKITPPGVVTTLAGLAGNPGSADGTGTAARFDHPNGVAVDNDGNVYVADTNNNAIRKITSAGVVSTLAGGSGSSANFSSPDGVAADSGGNVYVADTSNNTIRKITPAGVVTTVAGSGYYGSADGTGSGASFNHPEGVALDAAGNIYVTDGDNNTIRKVSPAGVVTTLAGSAGSGGNASGTGSAARFDYPQGIAVDTDGNVYVADSYNNTIRIGHRVNPAPQLANISTRLAAGTGDNALIGGFIITGTQTTRIIVRAIGPSLTQFGVPGALADPTLELYDSTDGALIARNDDWYYTQVGGILLDQYNEIRNCGLAPNEFTESAIIATLSPGSYTAIVRGKNDTTGVALVEAYDLEWGVDSKLANISTRGLVETGDHVMIGGTIIRGSAPTVVLFRAIGPSLTNAGVSNALEDPTLELHDGNGAVLSFNDNWRETQGAEIQARGLAPANDLESAILATLSPGPYTAIVRSKNGMTGVALVEAYQLDN